ncbi:hypothetical protein NVSP9465_01463 [Novosphingobium sp. CECT 9465]|nr:hypothetical protein NVSP9465_01463 [Novosphingobium sp. CECT 9465]
MGNELMPYDLAHLETYLRLLDAAGDATASWEEVVAVLFGLDAALEPERARRVHDSHLARARWMSSEGYRQLAALQQSPPRTAMKAKGPADRNPVGRE